MDDKYVDAYLKASGIDMTKANERLEKMVDAAKESLAAAPRCDWCNHPLPDDDTKWFGRARDDSVFCSEACAESAEDDRIEQIAEDGGFPRYGL